MVIKVEKRSWKILYSDYSGMEKKAVELYKLMLKYYTRPGDFSPKVNP